MLVRFQFSSGYHERMKKPFAIAIAAAALLSAAPADKFTGTITDDMDTLVKEFRPVCNSNYPRPRDRAFHQTAR